MLRGRVASPFTALGAGNNTVGYWLGTGGDGISKLIIAPYSTEKADTTNWAPSNTLRGTNNTTYGLPNTNTLAALGSSAHPLAYYCKNLTTGGYNTWYLPSQKELLTIYSNKSRTPFNTNDNGGSSGMLNGYYSASSTEVSASQYYALSLLYGTAINSSKSGGYGRSTRAVRLAP